MHNEISTSKRGSSASVLDRAWADRVSVRLRESLARAMVTLPATASTPTGLSRHLGLQMTLCYRALSGSRDAKRGIDALAELPGVEGLRKFADALSAKGAPAQAVSELQQAIAEFESLIATAGGSQRRLLAALKATPATGTSSKARKDQAICERMFLGHAELLGCRAETIVSVRVYLPAAQPRFARDSDVLACSGRVQFSRTSAAMPYVVTHTPGNPKVSSTVREPVAALADFCSKPLPHLSIDDRGNTAIAVIDPDLLTKQPIDYFAGPFALPNIARRDDAGVHLTAATGCSCPAEWLLNDVFVPRQWMDRLRCNAYATIAITGSMSDQAPMHRWFDRLPLPITPGFLGQGLGGASSELHPKHADLVARMFELRGLLPDDFVGFRLQVAFPVLFAHYTLAFDVPDAAAGAIETQ